MDADKFVFKFALNDATLTLLLATVGLLGLSALVAAALLEVCVFWLLDFVVGVEELTAVCALVAVFVEGAELLEFSVISLAVVVLLLSVCVVELVCVAVSFGVALASDAAFFSLVSVVVVAALTLIVGRVAAPSNRPVPT